MVLVSCSFSGIVAEAKTIIFGGHSDRISKSFAVTLEVAEQKAVGSSTKRMMFSLSTFPCFFILILGLIFDSLRNSLVVYRSLMSKSTIYAFSQLHELIILGKKSYGSLSHKPSCSGVLFSRFFLFFKVSIAPRANFCPSL